MKEELIKDRRLGVTYPVRYVEQLNTDTLAGFSFEGVAARMPWTVEPYVFFAITVREGSRHIFFGDAPRHAELQRAIEKGEGKFEKWIHGQLNPGQGRDLHVNFHYKPGETQEETETLLRDFVEQIDPALIGEEILFSWEDHLQYVYEKGGELEKVQRDWE